MKELLDVEKKYKISTKCLTRRSGMIYNTIRRGGKLVVIDTNVILSGLQSRQGKSFELISQIGNGKFDFAISNPLVLEYEKVLKSHLNAEIYTYTDIMDFLKYLCAVGTRAKIFYLWRPYLKDPFDDHVLEVALNANADSIITFNKKDFLLVQNLGLKIQTPKEFLAEQEADNETL